MPITRKQFKLGIDNLIERWMLQIHEHVSRNRDKAYSRDDLVSALSYLPVAEGSQRELVLGVRRHPVEPALEKLVELDAIEARVVDGVPYYAYKRELILD